MLDVINDTPAQMLWPERLLLYSLIYSLRPSVALEIGTAQGGAALIICAAMEAVGSGRLVCVDPAPQIASAHLARIAPRAVLVEGLSPEAISRAYERAGSRFDFVFIDGDHSYEGVLKDIEAAFQVLSPAGYLLFHDAHYMEVEEAVNEALRRYPFIDCGMLSTDSNPTGDFYKGRRIVWGGLRLLRAAPSNGNLQDQELPHVQVAQAQTELDMFASQVRERLNALPGWRRTLARKTVKFTYRALLGVGRLIF